MNIKKQRQILLSFVGTNDAGKLMGLKDGAILTALSNQSFDEVKLLWNKSSNKEINYLVISNYIKLEISERNLAKKTELIELSIKDVTDHNNIYIALKEFTDKLEKKVGYKYTAAISSGTPAMQVCWILLSESGDFSETNNLNLIKVKDPKFGKSENIPVIIDTSLPKIIRLKEENENLKKDFLPDATISISRPGLRIGAKEIRLKPIEIIYYKYFAERVIEGKGNEKFPMYNTTNAFLDKIIQIHKELFPEADSSREELIRIRKNNMGLGMSTFRGNISKLNRELDKTLHPVISNYFKISSEGLKGAKFYGIKLPCEKIFIVN